MCLITLNWQPDTPAPLIVAANRDEFYARQTLGLRHWPGQGILAGQDLQAGGTWLGLGAATGRIRLAALTNYRDLANYRPDAKSRGHITAAFLNSAVSAQDFLETLVTDSARYNPFNLILFDGQQLMGFESRHARLFELPVGMTSVSNADFNTPWPKLERLHTAARQALAKVDDEAERDATLFTLLSDRRVASDTTLPHTGLALDRERVLSAIFIRTPDYGTRASSVIVVKPRLAEFTERSFDANGFKGEIKHTISCSDPSL